VNKLRGYITSRKFMGESCHQSTQNLVLRDYCVRMNYKYLLSGTEYSISNSYLMLKQIVNEIPKVKGIVCYSVFQMPENFEIRIKLINKILEKNGELHFALENIIIAHKSDIDKVENIWLVTKTMKDCIVSIYQD